MGKSNRIRVNRANERISSPGVRKKGNGMPGWAMTLITVVVAAAILLSALGIVISSSGIIGGVLTSVKTENFKISTNMMQYFFNAQYQNFYSTCATYYAYYGATTAFADRSEDKYTGLVSYDPEEPMDKQDFNKKQDDASFLDISEKDAKGIETWYDYFVFITENQAKSTLALCEYAKANKIELDDDDYKTIDDTIASFEEQGGGNYPVSTVIANYYGDGVSINDVKKCMELVLLATAAAEEIEKKIDSAVTVDEINKKYNANILDYNVVDYTYYSFYVSYDDVAEEVLGKSDPDDSEVKNYATKINEAYKKKIEVLKAAAEALKGQVDIKAFQNYVYDYVIDEAGDESYGGQTVKDEIKPKIDDIIDATLKAELSAEAEKRINAELATYAENKKPDDAKTKEIKAKHEYNVIKEYFIEKIETDVYNEIVSGKETTEDVVKLPEDDEDETSEDTSKTDVTYPAYGINVKESFAEILNDVKTEVFDEAIYAKDAYTVEKKKYVSDEDDLSKWAFKDDAKVGMADLVLYTGDIKNGEDAKTAVEIDKIVGSSGSSSRIAVYRLTKTSYKDITFSKNFAYMTFSSEDDAKAAIATINNKMAEIVAADKTFVTNDFAALTTEVKADAYQTWKNYTKGSAGISGLDTFLFDSETTNGMVTRTPIAVGEGTEDEYYMVVLFERNGEEQWYLDVKNEIVTEKSEEENDALMKKYAPKASDWTYFFMNKIAD